MTPRDVPDATVAQLFEEQAARTPGLVALRFEDQRCTYAELNAAANRLARELVARGVGPERIVALALPRSIDAVVAMLAVFKAGGGYLPVDPEYPEDRIAYVLADARPVLVLVARAVTPLAGAVRLPAVICGLPALPVEVALARAVGACCDDLTDSDRLTPLRPDHPAYVIYTSGSTGRPKGVVVTHLGIPSLTAGQGEAFRVGPGSRVLQFASPSFDAAVSEVCMALLRGATLVLAPQARLAPGTELSRLITAHGVTHATLPPAVLPLQEGEDRLPADLALIVAGEACPAEVAARWAPGRLMINGYGLTETTVCATMTGPLRGGGNPPIGRPIRNTRVHVLDTCLQPVPVGAVGELFVAGRGLARGYLWQPGLTAARFVADPFGPAGTRMYRTGDLARRRPDGSLDFLGRVDDQITIRGYRVEPAEIETVLAEDPDVAQARVIARRDSGGSRLVAYVVPAPGARIHPAGLRRRVAERLPPSLVPVAVVELDRLPLTVNGKLDQAALPVPRFAVASSGAVPRTPQEEILCRLFADVLALPRVGVDDNFFELGGDSLLATRLAARVRATLGAELPVVSMIEAATPSRIAARLGVGHADAALEVLLPLRPYGTRAPLFCLHPAGGISWCYAPLLAHIDRRHSVYGIQAPGLTGPRPCARSMDDMVAGYLAAIREVQPEGPYCLLGWSFGGLVAHSLAAHLQREGERVALLALLDAYPEIPPELWHDGGEAALLADLLHFINVPADEVGDQLLDRATVLSVARSEGSALASLDDPTIERVIDVFARNHELLRTYAPQTVRGDVLFFTAARGRLARADAAAVWKAYVDGEIRNHDVDCEHRDMARLAPMAQIGPVVAAHLSASRRSQ